MTVPTSEHARALAAGMTPGQAARWLAYLRLKTERGEQPIDLHDAVRQLRRTTTMDIDEIERLDVLLTRALDAGQITVEDEHGQRLNITRTRVVGAVSRMPALLVRVEPERTESLF